MKIKLFGLAVVTALAAAAPLLAGNAPITATPLALGKMSATTIHAQSGSMVLESIKIAPGGSFGWHTHTSPVAVVVKSGTLTVFDPAVGNCEPFKVSKGQAFVEPANHVHLARNEGTAPVKVDVTYLGVPQGAAPDTPAKEPSGCSVK
jgi:quercetin dioxygenase-like cupin family protein